MLLYTFLIALVDLRGHQRSLEEPTRKVAAIESRSWHPGVQHVEEMLTAVIALDRLIDGALRQPGDF
ncbi:hypothetical protein OAH34_02485 [bacterium]|nr:hypothetical protein [bacterium]